MEKGATAVESSYFSHARQRNVRDSVSGNHDNCFGLNLSHMLNKRTLLFAGADVKKERNQFSLNALKDTSYPSYNAYNAGFDSSIVYTRRKTISAGIEFFFTHNRKTIHSLAASIGWHGLNMNESGLLHQSSYRRFYKMNQLSLSLQQNFLFNKTSRLKLAWVNRLIILKNLEADTDYSPDEKLKSGLRDKGTNALVSMIGLYAEYKPFNNVPIYINGHLFNDLIAWNHLMADYELGRVYVKGTGVSTGIKYIFK